MTTHRTKLAAATALLSTAALAAQPALAYPGMMDLKIAEQTRKVRSADKHVWDASFVKTALDTVTKPFASFTSCERCCSPDAVVNEKWEALELVDRAEKDTDDWRTVHKREGEKEFVTTDSDSTYRYTFTFTLPFFNVSGDGRVDKDGDAFKEHEYEVAIPTKATATGEEDFEVSYDKLDEEGLDSLKSDVADARQAAVTNAEIFGGSAAALFGLGSGLIACIPGTHNEDQKGGLIMGTTLSMLGGIATTVLAIVSCTNCCAIEKKQAILEHEHCHAHVKTGKLLQAVEREVHAVSEAARTAAEDGAATTATSSADEVIERALTGVATLAVAHVAESELADPAARSWIQLRADVQLRVMRADVDGLVVSREADIARKEDALRRIDALMGRLSSRTSVSGGAASDYFKDRLEAIELIEQFTAPERLSAGVKEVAVVGLRDVRAKVEAAALSEHAEQRAVEEAERDSLLRRIDHLISKFSPVSVWIIVLSVLGGLLVLLAVAMAAFAASRNARSTADVSSCADRAGSYGNDALLYGEGIQGEEAGEPLMPGSGERV